MKKMIFIAILCSFFACKDTGDIDQRQAKALVSNYLESNPMFETGIISTNRLKLKSRKNAEMITALQELQDQGFIEVIDEKSRKKLFSKDSVFLLEPVITQKALPYVTKQEKNQTEVKTVIYNLDPKQEITFERKADKTAVFNVIFLKQKTPFYHFGKDKNPNSEFVTQKFKAKYSKEEGWQLIK